jgi:hypothetical protein
MTLFGKKKTIAEHAENAVMAFVENVRADASLKKGIKPSKGFTAVAVNGKEIETFLGAYTCALILNNIVTAEEGAKIVKTAFDSITE